MSLHPIPPHLIPPHPCHPSPRAACLPPAPLSPAQRRQGGHAFDGARGRHGGTGAAAGPPERSGAGGGPERHENAYAACVCYSCVGAAGLRSPEPTQMSGAAAEAHTGGMQTHRQHTGAQAHRPGVAAHRPGMLRLCSCVSRPFPPFTACPVCRGAGGGAAEPKGFIKTYDRPWQQHMRKPKKAPPPPPDHRKQRVPNPEIQVGCAQGVQRARAQPRMPAYSLAECRARCAPARQSGVPCTLQCMPEPDERPKEHPNPLCLVRHKDAKLQHRAKHKRRYKFYSCKPVQCLYLSSTGCVARACEGD